MRITGWILIILLLIVVSVNKTESGTLLANSSICEIKKIQAGNDIISEILSFDSHELDNLNRSLKTSLLTGNYEASGNIVKDFFENLQTYESDSIIVSDSYYYVGVYYLLTGNLNDARRYLEFSKSVKESLNLSDEVYAKALYNLGSIYARLGLFNKHKEYSLRSLEVEKKIYGPESLALISTYMSLVTAYIELKDYDKALELANIAFSISEKEPEAADPYYLAILYINIGVLYNSIGDYSKGRIFLEKAEKFFIAADKTSEDGYLNLMNSMENTLRILGSAERAEEYYKKSIALARNNYSFTSFTILNNYAIRLGVSGKVHEGDSILSDLLLRTEVRDGSSSQNYFEVLSYYAGYLREFKIDRERSLRYYEKCIEYIDKQGDSFLKFLVKTGYALVLADKGEYVMSLETIQSLLFQKDKKPAGNVLFANPDMSGINADRDFTSVLRIKYEILNDYYKEVPDHKILLASTNTAELIISLLEKIRITISEEESRLILGDRYRDSYLNVIHNFYLLFSTTSDPVYLEKAFEYSEKSKIAGLLAATRELKATQFHIPEDLAELERELQRETGLLNALISGGAENETVSDDIMSIWKENLFNTIRKKDSLITLFEKKYPDYYSIKYNTHVSGSDEVPGILGKKSNYISYVASDTMIYVNIVNRRHHKLLAIPVDSSFYDKVSRFRNLLSFPSFDNARNEFADYQIIGYELYNTLIEPLKPYLISARMVISPDYILSYLPFETLPVNTAKSGRLAYNDIEYMMEKFDISYTYSATFSAESIRRDYSKGTNTIAFAPNYYEPVSMQSILLSRQKEGEVLYDLPYARLEAEFVSEIMNGKLLINENAKESYFKAEAEKYDIIHLAMHTVLNDKDPMYSTLIFSPDSLNSEDRFLRTYEIYGIPLKAKMVILSSCNTGAGKLYSGEGILSLARGFIYSGSESVVMSMWEIEDRSGTEIIKLYYKYLKRANSKSKALQKARMEFLKTADQLRSHPYFWSALVIYGDNTPLYHSKWMLIFVALFVTAGAVLIFYYLRKRRYS